MIRENKNQSFYQKSKIWNKENKMQKVKSKEVRKKGKKAQQEMVGFVLIILLIVIIGLVFMTFGKGKPKPEENMQVSSLLEAILDYTTECTHGIESISMQELIKGCYYGDTCSNLDPPAACQYLNDLSRDILDKTIEVSEIDERPIKGYILTIKYPERTDKNIEIQKGELKGKARGSTRYIALLGEEDIIITINLYL